MKRLSLLAAAAVGAFATACPEAPEALNGNLPAAPGVDGVATGVTAAGEGRARFTTNIDLGNGIAGIRVHLSDAAGLSVRHPATRYQPSGTALCIGGLTPGAALTGRVVAVNNIGLETGVDTAVAVAVDVPATNTDVDPPAPAAVTAVAAPGGIALTWSDITDVFAWHVFRSADGGAEEEVAVLPCNGTPGFFDSSPPGPNYAWSVVGEDLAGNLGGASNVVVSP